MRADSTRDQNIVHCHSLFTSRPPCWKVASSTMNWYQTENQNCLLLSSYLCCIYLRKNQHHWVGMGYKQNEQKWHSKLQILLPTSHMVNYRECDTWLLDQSHFQFFSPVGKLPGMYIYQIEDNTGYQITFVLGYYCWSTIAFKLVTRQIVSIPLLLKISEQWLLLTSPRLQDTR